MAIHINPIRPNYIQLRTSTNQPVRQLATATANRATGQQSSSSASAASTGTFQTLVTGTASTVTPSPTPATPPKTTPPAQVATVPAGPTPAPTAESAFSDNPWLSTPFGTGPNGVFYYNNIYFATPDTAAKVAQMVGGTVVEQKTFTGNDSGNPYQQQQPNEMVRLPNGSLINPGLVASFYTHGYPQSYIDNMINLEVKNTPPPTVG